MTNKLNTGTQKWELKIHLNPLTDYLQNFLYKTETNHFFDNIN